MHPWLTFQFIITIVDQKLNKQMSWNNIHSHGSFIVHGFWSLTAKCLYYIVKSLQQSLWSYHEILILLPLIKYFCTLWFCFLTWYYHPFCYKENRNMSGIHMGVRCWNQWIKSPPEVQKNRKENCTWIS